MGDNLNIDVYYIVCRTCGHVATQDVLYPYEKCENCGAKSGLFSFDDLDEAEDYSAQAVR